MPFTLDQLAAPATPQAPATIRRIETFIYRAKVAKPVVSTLASISQRVALLVRVEDGDGAFGWGEVYGTMPPYGAEHRANVVHQSLAPLLLGQAIRKPAECWLALSKRMQAMAIQTGEPGPFSAALGGLDCALWDLLARRAGLPLCALLGRRVTSVPAYASGLNPADGPEVVEASRALGFRAFKQKIGFGEDTDLGNLGRIRAGMAAGEALMVDVNQGWSIDAALAMAPKLTAFDLAWVEEPLMADRQAVEWQRCAAAFAAPLAGGENLRASDFAAHTPWLGVLQPDVGKWGGISASWAVGRTALAAGRRYCPHWLGAGIGLMHSAHVLAAVGGDGLLEVDVNENPLRETLCQPFPRLTEGAFLLNDKPGIGATPDQGAAAPWLARHEETT